MLPLLRIRTECSFRRAYGKIDYVAEVIEEMGVPSAAIVDDKGTWGHARWFKALNGLVKPAFGFTATIALEDGRKPVAWALAMRNNTRAFYKASSSNPTSDIDWEGLSGKVIRFAGSALGGNPLAYDYMDIDPSSVTEGRRRILQAKRDGKPCVLVPYNDYPTPEDKEFFLAWDDSDSVRPRHIDVSREAFDFLTDAEYEEYSVTTKIVGALSAQDSLPSAPIIKVEGDINAMCDAGKKYRLESKHIDEWTQEYEDRLQRELAMIEKKDYSSYFIMVAELVIWSKKHMLVGPARGSSAGSLVCYLMEITEVDPLPYGLLFERFIDINRDDLPDIDIDFNDKKRFMVFDYLAEKYGQANVAKIGSFLTLKPRSVMAHASKKLGINRGATFPVLNVLIEYSSGDARYGKGLEDTLQNTVAGQTFIHDHPEFRVANELENHASHTGVHAAGIIVCNDAITEYCTVIDGVAQIDKKDAEALNLLKIDALGLRTLGVIEDSGVISQRELFSMKFNDQEVLDIINQHKFSGVFQFEGAAQRSVSVGIHITEFQQIDHITALARPGPLGGGAAAHYVSRAAGKEKVEYRHPSMAAYLDETMGVVLYQEQVMRIVREIGDFSWEDTSTIRKAMSGRKGQEFFDRYGEQFAIGAKKMNIEEHDATAIWNEICGFGAWGMNKSHTHSYAVISYWCAWLKRYHPLEYAAATLRNAKDEEQTVEILRELRDEGVMYIPFDAALSDITWAAKGGRLIGGFDNLFGIGRIKAAKLLSEREAGTLTVEKIEALTSKHKPRIGNLAPIYTMYSHIYDNPAKYNVMGQIKRFSELEANESAVVVCQLIRKERRDENEGVRVARRGGKRFEGQSLFLDLFMVDDSVAKPVRVRISKRDWISMGVDLAETARNKEDYYLVRGKWLKDFSMMNVQKIKCITKEVIYET